MTLDVHRRRDTRRCRKATVTINREDVTKRCFYADARRGVVRLHVVNTKGQATIDRALGCVATEERRGRVRIAVGA